VPSPLLDRVRQRGASVELAGQANFEGTLMGVGVIVV